LGKTLILLLYKLAVRDILAHPFFAMPHEIPESPEPDPDLEPEETIETVEDLLLFVVEALAHTAGNPLNDDDPDEYDIEE